MFITPTTVKCFLFPGFSKVELKGKKIGNYKCYKFGNVINNELHYIPGLSGKKNCICFRNCIKHLKEILIAVRQSVLKILFSSFICGVWKTQNILFLVFHIHIMVFFRMFKSTSIFNIRLNNDDIICLVIKDKFMLISSLHF